MQTVKEYQKFRREIVDNLMFCTEKQALYMAMYAKQGKNCQQIADECGKEKSTVSRTLQRAWTRLRPVVRSGQEVNATFTFNANGDIIGMRANRTAVRGNRGRVGKL